MDPVIREKRIYTAFEISVALKGLHAVIEIAAGLVLCFVNVSVFSDIAIRLAAQELAEDPRSFVAGHVLHYANEITASSEHFLIFYLLSHGIIKTFLVAGLLRDKLWAYPASLAVLGLFLAYQLYRFFLTSSPFMLALSLFDILVLWLIWHEYQLRTHDRVRI